MKELLQPAALWSLTLGFVCRAGGAKHLGAVPQDPKSPSAGQGLPEALGTEQGPPFSSYHHGGSRRQRTRGLRGDMGWALRQRHRSHADANDSSPACGAALEEPRSGRWGLRAAFTQP